MKNWKGTTGEVFTVKSDSKYTGEYSVFSNSGAPTFGEDIENVKLIEDSFNTIQKCDLLPSELLQQRDKLLEALKESNKVISNTIRVKGGRDFGKNYMNDRWVNNEELIKSIEL